MDGTELENVQGNDAVVKSGNPDGEETKTPETPQLPAPEPTSAITASIPSNKMNVEGGNFVGGTSFAIGAVATLANTILQKYQVSKSLTTENYAALFLQIENMRGRITKLIPAIHALDRLKRVKYCAEKRKSFSQANIIKRTLLSIYNFEDEITYTGRQKSFSQANIIKRTLLSIFGFDDEEIYYAREVDPKEYLKFLREVQERLTHPNGSWNSDVERMDGKADQLTIKANSNLTTFEIEPHETPDQAYQRLYDEVNVRMSTLYSEFISDVYQAAGSAEYLNNQIQGIGHRDLREEAKTRMDALLPTLKAIDMANFETKEFDILSEKANQAISTMIEIENRKQEIQDLIRSDKKRRDLTVFVVIGYIALALVGTIIFAYQNSSALSMKGFSLSDLRMPLINIPWPVIVWSLIGSFAAMIHRFNKQPIYDFGDAVKWLLTRPIQGAVLGSAFYLVVVSGLFLLTGSGITEGNASSPADEAILIFSFLVGFSDRFADSVFNALLRNFSKEDEEDNSELEGQMKKSNASS